MSGADIMSVQSKIESGVAHIKLTNPKSGNAIDASLVEGLSRALSDARQNETCRIIVLSAEGDEFCRGMDLEEAFQENGELDERLPKMLLDIWILIRTSDRPIIACVEGNVSGGGVGLVAACDIVLADENVTFMLPEVIVGMMPALIAPFLFHRISPGRARYMALSTRGIKAREAMIMGLVDEVSEDSIEATLNRQLQRLFHSSPRALAETKKYFESMSGENLREQGEKALTQLMSWVQTAQNVDDILRFSSGVPPSWFQKYRGKKNV